MGAFDFAARADLCVTRAIEIAENLTTQKELEMDKTTITDRSILVTGANRGIGQALVEEALRRGADRVYAGARRPFVHRDRRVTPVVLDVTDRAQIRAA